MSYTIDINRSKDIRKGLKKKPLSFHLDGGIWGRTINQDFVIRFINCESYTSAPYITIEVSMDKTFNEIMDIPQYWSSRQLKRAKDNFRELIRHNPQVKKYLKVYLAHFGIRNYHIKTIKFKHNEVKPQS